ncbi:MAG: hypothetical protein BGO51_27890 [Rhodospirillales bacterium 69-11]|nr:hypothetical protein [Rhodospirillales bacterium]MBN8906506.1 hypothetical protein [Rhodospirillales bacterium]MBN8929295.1 hypothetical protein [Rhodospirillales bacterium]OJW25148.1 MAG: hypothetical protein BGO51_27890 [Rhodospirillales bacterium 69-11]
MQALDDIRCEPRSSLDHLQAVSFFLAGGEWAKARAAIADQLGLHPDDLERAGRMCVAARDTAEPPELPPAPEPETTPSRHDDAPHQAFIFSPPPQEDLRDASEAHPAPSRSKRWRGPQRLPPNANPFFPRGIADSGWKVR